ncbi:MAG: AAA family ATPase [Planctomycetes bacterium]|nr:AAA family ATPase [Planctomycetota bacterium]
MTRIDSGAFEFEHDEESAIEDDFGDEALELGRSDHGPPGSPDAPPSPAFREWLAALPFPTPKEIVGSLRQHGYRGQDAAVKSVSLAAHRHLRRLRHLYLDGVARRSLPPKQNLLLIGPTGCGKTFLAETLFERVLEIPTTTVDITAFSESGYIGEDVNTLVTRLLFASEGDIEKTRVGMICIDEFDKLASSSNRAVFAGQGTTKDVSGFGVQRELLKMFDGATIPVPTHFSHESYSSKPLVPTHDIAFVCCGAFSGLKSISQAKGFGIGFGRDDGVIGGSESIAVLYDQEEVENVVHFQEYGFLPELIGRFTRIVPFAPLDEKTLLTILEDNVLAGVRKELELGKIELVVEDDVAQKVVREAIEKETGARGLRARLSMHLEEALFEAFSGKPGSTVVLELDGDRIRSRLVTAKGRRNA